MPGLSMYERPSPKTWARMERWERKAWHRENAVRALRGQPPLRKP